MSRRDSDAMVPKTSELLPDPETPVKTVRRRLGISTLMSLRLFSRAPWTRMRSWRSAACGMWSPGEGGGSRALAIQPDPCPVLRKNAVASAAVDHLTGCMTSSDLWTTDQAQRYDSEEGVPSPEAVDALADLAHGGRALELAIGTGRIGVPLSAKGVPVAGIELSQPMVDVLRTKVGADEVPVVVGDMATTRVEG